MMTDEMMFNTEIIPSESASLISIIPSLDIPNSHGRLIVVKYMKYVHKRAYESWEQ